MKTPEEIIVDLIERIILTKYPFLTLKKVDLMKLSNINDYNVRFLVKEKPDTETQMKIDTDVKKLFKLTAMDDEQDGKRSQVYTWFKTPGQKTWTFHAKPGYNRQT